MTGLWTKNLKSKLSKINRIGTHSELRTPQDCISTKIQLTQTIQASSSQWATTTSQTSHLTMRLSISSASKRSTSKLLNTAPNYLTQTRTPWFTLWKASPQSKNNRSTPRMNSTSKPMRNSCPQIWTTSYQATCTTSIIWWPTSWPTDTRKKTSRSRTSKSRVQRRSMRDLLRIKSLLRITHQRGNGLRLSLKIQLVSRSNKWTWYW